MKHPNPIDSDFLFLIYDVAQLMRRRADAKARAYGMTRAQWALLTRLKRQPNLTQNDLAQLTEVEPITVGRLIDRLELSGHVERTADPKDRRVWRLRLTEKCSPLLAEINHFRRDLNAEMSADIDQKTLDSLVHGLQRMRINLSGPRRKSKKSAQS